MYRVMILGAGKIGATIAKFLHYSGDYDVMVADLNKELLGHLVGLGINTKSIDVTDVETLTDALKGFDAAVSACSYSLNTFIAKAAIQSKVSYFDLTEDVETTERVRALAENACDGQILMPQCGLAPGFIGILGHDLSKKFDRIDRIKMRVGALPQFPSNLMMYNLTWSTDGLINEYCNSCKALVGGSPMDVLPLEGLEHFSLDGMDYEAFNTSGGLGTLCETLQGKVRDLDYKTVRYKGHCHLMSFLTKGLKLGERRDILKDILEHAVPITKQDVVLVFCEVQGWREGNFEQITDARKVYHADVHGEHWSSIQITTAASMCAVIDLHREGYFKHDGFIKQEEVGLDDFLKNRFGKYYCTDKSTSQMFAA